MSKLINWESFFDFNEKGTDLGILLNGSAKKKKKTKGHESALYRSLCCRTKCN